MSRYNDDFRPPRHRGFDDDYAPSPYGSRQSAGQPRHSFGGQQAAPSGPVITGTVKWYKTDKGFGFVELSDGSGDAFLHVSVLEAAGHQAVSSGATLKVQIGQGQKGPQITNVLEVDESTAVAEAPRARPRPGFGGPGGAGGFGRPEPDLSRAVELQGTVKWYNAEKGFGFVSVGDGGKDVFVHVSVLNRAGFTDLSEGQAVSIKTVDTPKGREAVSISNA